jgi:hypothetical protein
MTLPVLFGGAPGVAWVPTDISGLQLWAAARNIDGLSDGEAISTWPDLSGNGNDLTQSGSQRPTWETNEINSLPCARFDGSNDSMDANAIASTFSGSDKPISVFMVCKDVASTSFDYAWSFGSSSTNNPWFALRPDDNSGWEVLRSDDVPTLITVNSGGDNTDQAYHVHSIIFPGTTVSHYIDTAVQINAAAMDAGTMTVDQFGLAGLHRTGEGANYQIDIAEILIYDSALSAADQLLVETYLNGLYAIY